MIFTNKTSVPVNSYFEYKPDRELEKHFQVIKPLPAIVLALAITPGMFDSSNLGLPASLGTIESNNAMDTFQTKDSPSVITAGGVLEMTNEKYLTERDLNSIEKLFNAKIDTVTANTQKEIADAKADIIKTIREESQVQKSNRYAYMGIGVAVLAIIAPILWDWAKHILNWQ